MVTANYYSVCLLLEKANWVFCAFLETAWAEPGSLENAAQRVGLWFLVMAAFFAISNWLMLFLTYFTGRHHSCVPLVGGIFAGLGILLVGVTRPWGWLILCADYGTWLGLLGLKEFWHFSRFNLLAEYEGESSGKTIHLHLFRRKLFALQQHFPPKAGVLGGEISVGGRWEWDGDKLPLVLLHGPYSAVFEQVPGRERQTLRLVKGFAHYEGTPYSLTDIELKLKYKRKSRKSVPD
jgi:hypothetical protein